MSSRRYTCRLSQETSSPPRDWARRSAAALLPAAVGPTTAIRGAATAARPPPPGPGPAGSPPPGPGPGSPVVEGAHDLGLVLGAQRALDRQQLGVQQLVEAVHQQAA